MPIRGFDFFMRLSALPKRPLSLLRNETLLVDGYWFLKKYCLAEYDVILLTGLDLEPLMLLIECVRELNIDVVWIWNGVQKPKQHLSVVGGGMYHSSPGDNYSKSINNEYSKSNTINNEYSNITNKNTTTHINSTNNTFINHHINKNPSLANITFQKTLNLDHFKSTITSLLSSHDIKVLTAPYHATSQAIFLQSLAPSYFFGPTDYLLHVEAEKLITELYLKNKQLEIVNKTEVLRILKMDAFQFQGLGLILGCDLLGTVPVYARAFDVPRVLSLVEGYTVLNAVRVNCSERYLKEYVKARMWVKYCPVVKVGGVGCLYDTNDNGVCSNIVSIGTIVSNNSTVSSNINTSNSNSNNSNGSSNSIDIIISKSSHIISNNTPSSIFGKKLPQTLYQYHYKNKISTEIMTGLAYGEIRENSFLCAKIKKMCYDVLSLKFDFGVRICVGEDVILCGSEYERVKSDFSDKENISNNIIDMNNTNCGDNNSSNGDNSNSTNITNNTNNNINRNRNITLEDCLHKILNKKITLINSINLLDQLLILSFDDNINIKKIMCLKSVRITDIPKKESRELDAEMIEFMMEVRKRAYGFGELDVVLSVFKGEMGLKGHYCLSSHLGEKEIDDEMRQWLRCVREFLVINAEFFEGEVNVLGDIDSVLNDNDAINHEDLNGSFVGK